MAYSRSLHCSLTCICFAPKYIMTYIIWTSFSLFFSLKGTWIKRVENRIPLYIMQMRGTKFWTNIISFCLSFSILCFLALSFSSSRWLASSSSLSFLLVSSLLFVFANQNPSRDASRSTSSAIYGVRDFSREFERDEEGEGRELAGRSNRPVFESHATRCVHRFTQPVVSCFPCSLPHFRIVLSLSLSLFRPHIWEFLIARVSPHHPVIAPTYYSICQAAKRNGCEQVGKTLRWNDFFA